MSEELPEELKLRVMKRMIRRVMEERTTESFNDIEREVWSKLVDERAKELMEKTKVLYPRDYGVVVKVFYELIKKGLVKEFDGYTTLLLLNKLGISVKPEMKLRFVKRGREVDLKNYVGD
ncbi:MAG: hypothetical protein N3E36_01555 [Sulfolobales archaeon]|nr:hypothetical protein [Sulfolobales archaeon]MCX8198700.1 hypothetical protein [Sulfolobales archaeon]MDW8169773.1 hypothetical protein [Desulfurococcaceae archaeon]